MYLFGELAFSTPTALLYETFIFLILGTAPVAWPIAKLLDHALGASEEGNTYKKAELRSFLQFHRQGEEPLRDDEISILNGVLELNGKKITEIMTHMDVSHRQRIRGLILMLFVRTWLH